MICAVSTTEGWGPSHQTGRRRKRTAEELAAAAVCASYFVGGTTVLIVCAAVWGVVFVLVVPVLKRAGVTGRSSVLDQVMRSEDKLAAVRGLFADREAVYLGVMDNGHWMGSRRQDAVLVLGPPRSRKTTSVVIPAIVSHTGPVVSTSTKTEVVRASQWARKRVGRCWLFDPTGSHKSASQLRWSPVAASENWDGAMLMARAMISAAGVGQGTTHSSHWANRAQALLGPFLHAAALDGRDMETVVDWVGRHELDEAGMLLEQERASRLAFGSLLGILNTEERERASVFSAAADALQAYTSEAALGAAKNTNFDPKQFVTSEDTIYICAPAEAQAAAAPIVCGLLSEIRRWTYRAHEQAHLKGRVLFALDEAANIAPLEELPQIASEGGGQGLTLLCVLQDLSQARARWGQAADGFLTLFGTKLILPGIADTRTLEGISTALGEYDRQMVATTRSNVPVEGLPFRSARSCTVSTQRTRVLSPGEIANIPSGKALSLEGVSWQLLTLTPAYGTEPWKTLTTASSGDQ
jgi:type IV secretion system protein VirD4